MRASTIQELYTQAYVGQSNWGLFNYVVSQLRGSGYYGAKYTDLYGKIYPKVIVEVSDQQKFNFDKDHPYDGGLYNYDLETDNLHITRSELMQTMQLDLKNCFGYEASMEERTMPCYKLVANPHKVEKLRSVHDKFWISPGSTAAGFEARHISVNRFLLLLTEYVGDDMPLLVDETGIDYAIDVKIDADLTNREQVMRELHKLGLDIVKAEKIMRVIVIRDAPVTP